jgi:hypothetical protein
MKRGVIAVSTFSMNYSPPLPPVLDESRLRIEWAGDLVDVTELLHDP